MKRFSIVILALALIVAGFYGWEAQRGEGEATASVNHASAAGNGSQGGFPGSASKVSIQSWLPGPGTNNGHRSVSIRLKISKGWHVNANPPSLPFLIPTAVKAEVRGKSVPIKVAYPPGHASGVVLENTDIDVYQSNTTLNAELPPDAARDASKAGAFTLIVQVQACSDKGICLPPATIHSRVPWT